MLHHGAVYTVVMARLIARHAGVWSQNDAGHNLTRNVLACPPAECLQYSCPSFAFQHQGLQSCDIDTANAPVGTVYKITFMVHTNTHPAATSTVSRLVRVVSPCQEDEVYCPSALTACGTADCTARTALEAVNNRDASGSPADGAWYQELQFPPGVLSVLHTDSARSTITDASVRSVQIAVPAGQPLPMELGVCAVSTAQQDNSDCGVLWGTEDMTPRPDLRLTSYVAVPGASAPACTKAALTEGRCPPGVYTVVYHAELNGQPASDEVHVMVRVDEPLATASVSATAQVQLPSDLSAETLAAIRDALSGTTDAFSPVLHQAQAMVTNAAAAAMSGTAAAGLASKLDATLYLPDAGSGLSVRSTALAGGDIQLQVRACTSQMLLPACMCRPASLEWHVHLQHGHAWPRGLWCLDLMHPGPLPSTASSAICRLR